MVYMVQAIINIDERTNRILNIIKAKYVLKDKSAAINKMAEEYENMILEPESMRMINFPNCEGLH
jgi:hypothetical protein